MPVPEECLPTRGYLALRLDHGRRSGKACDLFTLMAGLVDVSGALGKQVWVPGAGEPIYPSVAPLLLGGSGVAWKSTTLGHTERILRKLTKVRVLPRTGSKEAFEKLLTQPPSPREEAHVPLPGDPKILAAHTGAGVLLTDELSLLFASTQKDYSRDLRPWLTSILGRAGRIDHGTLRERREASDLALTFFGLAPDQWFLRSIKPVDFIEGLIPRLDLVADDGMRELYGLIQEYDPKAYQALAERLAHQSRILGELQTDLIRPAMAVFDRHILTELMPAAPEEAIRILDSRRLVTAVRYAICYHVAEADSAGLTEEDWTRAKALTLYLRERSARLIQRHYAPSWEDRFWKDVLAFIREHPGCTHHQIIRRFHLFDRHKLRVLSGLTQAELIYRHGKGVKGDPQTYWPEPPTPDTPEEVSEMAARGGAGV